MQKKLAEADFILDKEGRIYHLRLRPDELADTVILVGDPGRVELISRHFDSIELKRQDREFVTHTGMLNNKRLSVVSTGISTANIDIVLNELDALVNIDFEQRIVKPEQRSLNLIRIGTAGSAQTEIPLDSYVVSEYGLALSNLINFYDYPMTEAETALLAAFNQQTHLNDYNINANVAAGDVTLVDLFKAECFSGITVTCPGFYAPQARNLRLPARVPELLSRFNRFKHADLQIANFEMETAAIYALGKAFGHRCVSISAIVANRIDQTFSNQAKQTIEKLIEYCLEKVLIL